MTAAKPTGLEQNPAEARTRVLLFYTGSPESPDPECVAAYLREFLMDPHVLAMPRPLRSLLVKGIIVPVRAGKSAARYKHIWMPEGSPLTVYTNRFRNALESLLPECRISTASAYGRDALSNALPSLLEAPVKRALVFPLFPHCAEATHGILKDALDTVLRGRGASMPKVRVVPPFYARPAYLEAVRAAAAPLLDAFRPDHVLFTYHGLPLRQAHAVQEPGMPDYETQCGQTTALLAEALQLEPGRFSLSYQSRFGRGWLAPSTDTVLAEFARSGKKRIALVAPSFVADCLETLEELDIGARDAYLAAGGEAFLRVPALNDHPAWVRAAAQLVREELDRG